MVRCGENHSKERIFAMENTDIARVFEEIADLLEIKGENPFRVRSYRNAALVVGGLPESVAKIAEERGKRGLEKIPGIGKSIAEKIIEMLDTGRCRYHEELLKEFPPGLLDMLKVSGVGPKKVALLYSKLGISTIDELEEAAASHKLHNLPGMGEKTEQKILKSIEDFRSMSGRFRLDVARTSALAYMAYLKQLKGIIDCVPAGSLRRWKESIGDVDILVTCKKGLPVMDRFVKYPEVKEIVSKGATKSTVILRNGLQVDLRVLEKKSFGAALQYFTGSKAHNIALRDRAKKRGLKISEYGVFREKDDRRVAGEKEEDVYRAVGLPWIRPELRENMGEIEAAEEGRLPGELEKKDLKGDLHVHTKATDGGNTMEEMAQKAMDMGYEYMAVTDHSKAVGIAHGLDEKRLLAQLEEIDRFNDKLRKKGKRFRVLKGSEVDIRADGSLDFSADILKRLDIVVGAVHSGFNMDRKEMTKRVVKAVNTGRINILAHPTGRLIGSREPYEIDMEAVMDAALKKGVYLELNSYPDRLDLNEVFCKRARERGILVAISTDSHSIYHMDNIEYGVHTAMRGWLEREHVLNTRPLEELQKLLSRGGKAER